MSATDTRSVAAALISHVQPATYNPSHTIYSLCYASVYTIHLYQFGPSNSHGTIFSIH